MTTTLIISDIHLGAHNSQTAALSRLLASDFDRLVLNGDTVDNLNFRRFDAGHWGIVDQLRSIARERKLILMRGNHEGMPLVSAPAFGPLNVLARLLGTKLREELRLVIGGRRYLMFHGDRFDRTLRMTWIGDVADAIYNRVQHCSRSLARFSVGRWPKTALTWPDWFGFSLSGGSKVTLTPEALASSKNATRCAGESTPGISSSMSSQ